MLFFQNMVFFLCLSLILLLLARTGREKYISDQWNSKRLEMLEKAVFQVCWDHPQL